MKLRNLLLALGLCAGVYAAAEDSGMYLHIETASGWQVLDLEKTDRLTFANGTMTATDAENNVVATFPQSELQNMRFSESAGVQSAIIADSADATFRFDSASASAIMLADGDFEIFSPAGALLHRIPAVKKGQTIDLGAITPGLVILKSGNFTLKTILK